LEETTVAVNVIGSSKPDYIVARQFKEAIDILG